MESLASDIQTACLPGKDQVEAGDVSSADNLHSLVPDQAEAGRQDTAASSAGTSASKELTGITRDTQEEAGGSQSHPQDSEEIHAVSDSETEQSSEMSIVTSEQDDAAKVAAAQLAALETGKGPMIQMRLLS